MKRIQLFSFLVLFFASEQMSLACACKGLAPLTIVECRKFDVILKCKIDSVAACSGEKSIGYAHVLEIYKGDVALQIIFSFDCASSCMMSLIKNETWLLYGNWNKLKQLELNLCDRNRKYFSIASEDYYLTNTGLSFENEIKYLKKNIGLKMNTATDKVTAIEKYFLFRSHKFNSS